jgi:DNA-binding PadR family transcriptional regulator
MPDRNPPPLTPAGYQVLLALAAGRTHGYAAMRFIEQVTGGAVRLGPGTLYRTIARLAADGLVEEADTDDTAESAETDARRRTYRLTPLGRAAARRESTLLARLVDVAAAAGLLPDEGRRSA